MILRDGVEGKICSKCGVWKPLQQFSRKLNFYHSHCKECMRAAYAAGPKPDKRAYYARYRAEHAEKIARYRTENKEKFREYAKAYLKRNPEKQREAKRKWGERNKAKRSEAYRRWRKNNPEKALQNNIRRRVRLRRAPGSFTLAEWEALKRSYGNVCLCCDLPEGEIKLVPDHVVPLARGGSNYITNIQPLCELCNWRKGPKTLDYRVRRREQ